MATPSIRRVLFRSGVTALLASGVAVAAVPGIGNAEPSTSIAAVQQRINALTAKVDAAVEQYNQAQISLSKAQSDLAAVHARLAQQQAAVDAKKQAMAQFVAAAYRSGGSDQLVTLVTTSSPQTFLDRADALDRLATGQQEALDALTAARLRLDEDQQAADQKAAQQKKATASLQAQKNQIQSMLAQQQQILSGLKAEQRRQLEAAQAAAAARAASQARASRDAYRSVPASGRAAIAVRFAYAQLGKPYQYGGAGPNTYDCSGLTMDAWGAAGVSLPHSAADQYNYGPHISRGDLQPGDLVFFGSPIHHVGIYIGNGNMIDAPHTGTVVQIQAVFRSDYVGASRPG